MAPNRPVLDSLIVTIGGFLERSVGTITALALKWGLDPTQHGIYSGLRLFLNHSNLSGLGIGRGAIQEIPVLCGAGRENDARKVGASGFTACAIGALCYTIVLVMVVLWRTLGGGSATWSDPIGRTWTIGLLVVALLVLLKRYQDFLIALHRAYQRFGLITGLAIADAALLAVLVIVGLWLAGMWGVFCAIAALMVFNVLVLHHRDPMRPGWLWDTEITRRLFWTGAPIMLNSAIYTVMMSLDRILLLSLGSNGAEAAGLYSVAWMGTSWCLDFSGRISLVMYTYFQRTIGRTGAPTEVAQQVVQVVEAIAAPLAAGLAVAYVVGPTFLGFIVPRYTEGLPAIRPLLPGVLLLGLARPIREAMIAVGRPIPLAICSIPGLMIAAALGANAAREGEIVALSFGLSLGYAVFYLAISLAFVAREQGFRPWLFHQGRLSRTILWYVTGALLAAHLPLGLENSRWFDFGARVMLLALWGLPGLVLWGKSYSWGGLYRGRPSTRKVED